MSIQKYVLFAYSCHILTIFNTDLINEKRQIDILYMCQNIKSWRTADIESEV